MTWKTFALSVRKTWIIMTKWKSFNLQAPRQPSQRGCLKGIDWDSGVITPQTETVLLPCIPLILNSRGHDQAHRSIMTIW